MADNNTINFNQVPNSGTFSGVVKAVNDNFDLAKIAILNMKGKSAYEIWKDQDGNENKSLDDFWGYLTADKGYTKQVLTYAEFSSLDPTTVSTSTLYVHPNEDNTEYYAKLSNGITWITIIEGDGDITGLVNDIETAKTNINKINRDLNRKLDKEEVDGEGLYLANGEGKVFMRYNNNGLDAEKVNPHFKELVAPDLSEYATKDEIPEQSNVIGDTDKDGIFFSDDEGHVFLKYDNENGLDANKVSEHFKGLVAPSSGSSDVMKDVDEIGAFFVGADGKVFAKYDNENGFDVNKISQHFKSLLAGGVVNMKVKEIPSLGSTKQTLEIPDIKYSAVYSFYGNIDTFGELVVYRSNPTSSLFAYAGTTITINTTNIVINDGGVETSYNHGLTIADFLMVNVIVETAINTTPVFDNKVQIILVTSSGVYRTEHTGFKGCMGDLKVAMTNGQMSNCVLSWSSCDLEKDVWVFGDSYLDYWVRFALQYGANNLLVDGHSGRGCAAAISSLQKLLGVTHPPKTIIWGMGMNNKDNITESNYSVNEEWLQTFQQVESLCDLNGIELYVCTIPNAPGRDNSKKNSYIRQSGHKIIDICEIVGADIQDTWYPNFKGSGNDIHPSILGSKVIAAKIIQSVPKIIKM